MLAKEPTREVSWRLLLTACLGVIALSARAATDPFAGLTAPVITSQNTVLFGDGSTAYTSLNSGGTPTKPAQKLISSDATLFPGIYWGGIKITGGNVTMMPGRYVIAGGGFNVSGTNTAVSGTNVFIYNTRDPYKTTGAGAYLDIYLSLDGMNLFSPTASTDGYYTGLLIFNDRSTNNNSVIRLTGTSSPTQGMLYSSNGLAQISTTSLNDAGLGVVAKDCLILPLCDLTLGGLDIFNEMDISYPAMLTLSNGFTDVHSGTLSVTAINSLVTIRDRVAYVVPLPGNDFNYTGSVEINGAISPPPPYTNVIVGKAAGLQGSLTVTGGNHQILSNLVVGSDPGAIGSVLMTGGQLSNATLVVGSSAGATGSVLVTGGSFIAGNSSALQTTPPTPQMLDSEVYSLSVTPVPPTVIFGDAGVGQFAVSNGVVQLGQTVVGSLAGSQGSMIIAGGSNQVFGLTVGDSTNASGTLQINGGLLRAGQTVIGNCGSGQMVVGGGTGLFSQLIVGNNGASGTGSVLVTDGLLLVSGFSPTQTVPIPPQMVMQTTGSSSAVNLSLSADVQQAQAYGNLTIGANTGAFGSVVVTGGQLSNTSTTIGDAGSGMMIISNGIASLGTTILGNSASGSGSLTVAGGSVVVSDFAIGNPMISGRTCGTGVVLVTGGQLVAGNTYIGGVGADGVGSGLLVVSNGSVHFLDLQIWAGNTAQTSMILAGGAVVSDSGMLVNDTMLVSGGNLFVDSEITYIGWGSSGTLTISNGTASFGAINVGLERSGLIELGGLGNLNVAGGTSSISGALLLGSNAGSTGSVLVTSGILNVTNASGSAIVSLGTATYRPSNWPPPLSGSGKGTLTLSGGVLNVDHLVATHVGNSIVQFNAGTLRSGGTTISNGTAFVVGDGASSATLHLMGGNHSFADGLFINTNGWLTGTGAITGVITNAGSIAPGDSAGILTGSGGLTLLDNSLLQMQLAGTDDWLYDQINLTDTLNFGGTLTLSLLDGFMPSLGNRFDLFDFTSSSEFFTTTNLPSLPEGLVWDLSLLYTSGEIEAGQTPVLLAAASRKVHSGAGTFDLNLTLDPLANPTVEPRKNGPDQIVLTFNKEMQALDGTLDVSEFTLTNATFVSAAIVSSNLTLNLTNVVDQARVTVAMNGLGDLSGNALAGTNAVVVLSLYGDVNQSGSVSVSDMQHVKNRLLQGLASTNFLADLNLTGTISVSDMQQVKNNLLHTVIYGGFNPISPPLQYSITPIPAQPPATLGDALGAPELEWSTNGDDVWTPVIAPDGSVAARSGSIGDLNVSWVETMVTGPATLSFEWSVSSELDGDFLTFALDGVDQPGRISGEAGWQTQSFCIPAGTHRLRWTYGKDSFDSYGSDAGWLRRVRTSPNP